MVLQINSLEEFEQCLKDNKDKLVVVDFWAPWCGPCRAIGPKFKEFSEDPANKNVVFLKVNVDEVEDVARKYVINAMPTFLFFKNGEVLTEQTVVGASEAKLKNTIATLRT